MNENQILQSYSVNTFMDSKTMLKYFLAIINQNDKVMSTLGDKIIYTTYIILITIV